MLCFLSSLAFLRVGLGGGDSGLLLVFEERARVANIFLLSEHPWQFPGMSSGTGLPTYPVVGRVSSYRHLLGKRCCLPFGEKLNVSM